LEKPKTMDLKNLDTSKFRFDPKKPSFEEDLIKESKVFDLSLKGVNRKKALIYIVLMWDINSEIVRSGKEYVVRKYEAGTAAGFNLHEVDSSTGKRLVFSKTAEDLFIGENDRFNKAVIQYVSLMHSPEYTRLVVVTHHYNKMASESLKSMSDKDNTFMRNMLDDINTLEQKLFGGEEVFNVKKALYEGTGRTLVKLRPEDEVDEFAINGLRFWSPYSDYMPEPLHFVGDKVPEDEV